MKDDPKGGHAEAAPQPPEVRRSSSLVELRTEPISIWDSVVERATLNSQVEVNKAKLALRDQQLESRKQDITYQDQDISMIRKQEEFKLLPVEAERNRLKLEGEVEEQRERRDKAQKRVAGGGQSILEQVDEFVRDRMSTHPEGSPGRAAFVRSEEKVEGHLLIEALEREFGRRIFDDPAIRQYLRLRHAPVDQLRPDRSK